MSSDNSSKIGIKKQCLRTRKQKEPSIQNVPLRNTANRKAKKRSLTNRESSFNKVRVVEKEDQTLLKYFHKTPLSQNNLTKDSKVDLPNLNTVSSSNSVLQIKMCNVKVPLIPLEETELLDSHTLNMLRKNKISSTSLSHTKSTNVQRKNDQQITKTPIVTLKQIKVMDGQLKLNKLQNISMPTATLEQTRTADIEIKKEKQDDIPITTLEETSAMDIENNQPNINIPAASSEHTKSMDTQIKNEKQIKVAVVSLERAVTNIQTENNQQMINLPKTSSKQTAIIDTEKENKKQNKVSESFLEKPRVIDVHIKNNQQIINMPVISSEQTLVKDIKIENEEQIKVPLVSLEETIVPIIQAKNNQQIINIPVTSSEQITVKNIKTENEEQVNIPLVSLEKITVPSVQGENNQQIINMPISSSEYIENEKIKQNNILVPCLEKPRVMVAQIKNNQQITSMPVTSSKQTTVKNSQIENEKQMKFPFVSLEKKTVRNIQAVNNQPIISMSTSSKHTEVLMGFNHTEIENKKLNNVPVASLEKSIAMDIQIENENQKKVPVISSEKTKVMNIQKENNQQKFNVIPNLKVSVSSLEQDKSLNTHFSKQEKVSIIPSVAMQNSNLKMNDFFPKIMSVNPNVTFAVLGTSGSHSNISNQIPKTNNTVISNTSIIKQQNIINTVSAPKINICNISNNPPQQLYEIKCPIIEVPKLITGSNNSTSTSNVSRIICMPVNDVSNVLQPPIVELPNTVPNTTIKMQQINVLNNNMSTVGGFIKLSPSSLSSENISQGLPAPIKIYHTSSYPIQPPITSAATKSFLLNSEFLCNNVISEKHKVPFTQASSILNKNDKVTNLNKLQNINFSPVCNSNNISYIPTARKVTIPLYQQDGKVSNKQTPNNSVQNKNASQYVILDHNYASSISLLNEKTGISKTFTKGKVLQDADQTETSSSESDTSFDDDIYDDDFFHMMEPEVILLEGKGTFFLTKGGDLKYLKPFQPMYSRQKPLKNNNNNNKTNQINKKTTKINKFNYDNSFNDNKDTITGIIVPKKTYQRNFNTKPLQQKFVFRNGEVASSLLQSCFVWLDRMNKDVLENGVVNLAETPIEKLFLLDNRIHGNEYSSKCKPIKNETLKQTEEIKKINKSEITKMKPINSPKKESNQLNPVNKMADVLRLLQDRRKALEALRHKRKLLHKPTFNINHQNHNSEHM